MKEKDKIFAVLLDQLRNELTESAVYSRLAQLEKNEHNKKILQNISADESAHARVISSIVGREGAPCKFKVALTVFMARVFGLVFVLKLMERGEDQAGKTYAEAQEEYPQLAKIAEDEERHENELIEMLDDEIVKSPKCPICHGVMQSQDRVLHSKGQKYTFHFNCKKDGDMLLVLRLRRNFNETWRAKRTIAFATEESLEEFKRGIERTAVKRKMRQRKPRGPRRQS